MPVIYSEPCCCNRDSLKFYMQYDYVLKKLNFALLTLDSGGGKGLQAESLVPCCCIRDSL